MLNSYRQKAPITVDEKIIEEIDNYFVSLSRKEMAKDENVMEELKRLIALGWAPSAKLIIS